MIAYLLIPLSYLLGSLSSAIIVCRAMGLGDPRGQGSGNPGATNVMRIGGKKAAILTLFGDMLKGFLPAFIASTWSVEVSVLALVVFAAFLGHLYPLFFNFKGGKGVATALGIALGVNWALGLAMVATWCGVFKISNISSLSALVTAALMPVYVWFIVEDTVLLVLFGLISVILLWRHRSNIERLLTGKEE